MISYWVNAAGSFGLEQYLARRTPDLAAWIKLRTYESLGAELEVSGGAHIFSALDQLSDDGRDMVGELYDRLAELRPADRLLNDPRRVSRRFQLLTKMFNAGINRFTAYRAAEDVESARFPVFVREESQHDGALTGLLTDPKQLGRALLALRVRGHRLADLLVVEFCDLSDAEGVVRSASAYQIGGHIVPAHLLSGHQWMLKWTGSDHDERAMQEHFDYVRGNPHEAWLRRVFALAGVDYGRVDYGVSGETLQVWEINLNPTLGPSRGPDPPRFAPKIDAVLQESRRLYNGNIQAAFRALDPDRDQSRVTVRLDSARLARVKAGRLNTERRHAARRFLSGIYEHRQVGWLFRAIYSRLLPRR